MRIAITGTRGIPNRYGGFERFAEKLASGLAGMGHEILVYNPHYHPYEDKVWCGAHIRKKRSRERLLGSGGNLLYDLSCMRDAIRLEVDVILECGYASAAPWYPFLRRGMVKLLTHMDGMEWQRAKWNWPGRSLFRLAERMAVRYSDAIVCDHPAIAGYYARNFRVTPGMIPYGAELRTDRDPSCLRALNLEEGSYFLLAARLEPENNIRMIIEGCLGADTTRTLVIVGAYSGRHGKALHRIYAHLPNIRFIGELYDENELDSLRHFSKAIFHGHSVGGTNPSLLEAMAAGSPILAHDNVYNRWVLEENALFFGSAGQISVLLNGIDEMKESLEEMIRGNLDRVRNKFQWEAVILRYQETFERMLGKSR